MEDNLTVEYRHDLTPLNYFPVKRYDIFLLDMDARILLGTKEVV